MLTRPLPLLVTLSLLFAGRLLAADETISPGTMRADLIAKHGNPKSVVNLGAKEIMQFPEGKVVLVNGVVKSFEAAPEFAEGDELAARVEGDATGGAVTMVHTNAGRWLTDPEMAQAHARIHQKNILVLLTGDMSRCPTGVKFNQEVANGISFARMMSSEFVLLKLDLNALGGGSPDAPVEIGSLAHKKILAKLAMLEELFPAHEVPAMAIVSADGKGSVAVDLGEPTSLAGYNIVLDSTLRAVATAKTQPMKRTLTLAKAARKINFAYVAAFGVILFFIVKRFR